MRALSPSPAPPFTPHALRSLPAPAAQRPLQHQLQALTGPSPGLAAHMGAVDSWEDRRGEGQGLRNAFRSFSSELGAGQGLEGGAESWRAGHGTTRCWMGVA